MRLTVVGSGGAVPHPRRRPPAHLLQQDGRSVLLDAGPGTLSCLAALGVRPADLDAVVLSHLHPDHALELVPLLFHRSWAPPEAIRPGLQILGPPGFREELSTWLEAVYPTTLSGANEDLVWTELDRDTVDLGPWRLDPLPARHRPDGASGARMVRIESDAGLLAYTGDTGPHAPLDDLLDPRGCLLCECNALDGADALWHLSPSRIRRLVDPSPPGLLVLTHIAEPLDRLPLPGPAFVGYPGRVVVAEDGMQLVWRSGEIQVVEG